MLALCSYRHPTTRGGFIFGVATSTHDVRPAFLAGLTISATIRFRRARARAGVLIEDNRAIVRPFDWRN